MSLFISARPREQTDASRPQHKATSIHTTLLNDLTLQRSMPGPHKQHFQGARPSPFGQHNAFNTPPVKPELTMPSTPGWPAPMGQTAGATQNGGSFSKPFVGSPRSTPVPPAVDRAMSVPPPPLGPAASMPPPSTSLFGATPGHRDTASPRAFGSVDSSFVNQSGGPFDTSSKPARIENAVERLSHADIFEYASHRVMVIHSLI